MRRLMTVEAHIQLIVARMLLHNRLQKANLVEQTGVWPNRILAPTN